MSDNVAEAILLAALAFWFVFPSMPDLSRLERGVEDCAKHLKRIADSLEKRQ